MQECTGLNAREFPEVEGFYVAGAERAVVAVVRKRVAWARKDYQMRSFSFVKVARQCTVLWVCLLAAWRIKGGGNGSATAFAPEVLNNFGRPRASWKFPKKSMMVAQPYSPQHLCDNHHMFMSPNRREDDGDGDDEGDAQGNNDDHEGTPVAIDDLSWRVEKLRLEEANTQRFLKAGPRHLPYEECRKWVQAWNRWDSEEEWKQWIDMGEKRNTYIPARPDEYYGKRGEWISWSHFLSEDHDKGGRIVDTEEGGVIDSGKLATDDSDDDAPEWE